MKLKLMGAVAVFAVLMSIVGFGFVGNGASKASASKPQSPLATQVPCTVRGAPTVCTVQVTSINTVSGAMQASGVVTSKKHHVTVPFSGVPLADPPGCPILNLTLGPLHLDLLGLVVDLNQVNLNVTAVPGAGALLGNLLCAVANLLNGTGTNLTALNAVLSAVNGILAGL